MVEFLLGALVVLVLALSGLNMALYVRVTRPDRERKAEEAVQAAMDDAEEESRRSRSMNEGIENIMQYQVSSGLRRNDGGGDG